MATCPECDAEIDISADDLEELEEGDPWDCDACGSRLRIVALEPLEFEGDDDEDEDEEEGEKETEESDDDEFDDDEEDESEDQGGDWEE